MVSNEIDMTKDRREREVVVVDRLRDRKEEKKEGGRPVGREIKRTRKRREREVAARLRGS